MDHLFKYTRLICGESFTSYLVLNYKNVTEVNIE